MQDGVLLVDKPGGMTSHDVVAVCRRVFNRRDIGHAGTLDPMATGLLVVLIGKATKLSDFLLNGDKAYRATVLLGTTTDTDDCTGEVLSSVPVEASEEAVRAAALKLQGKLEIAVPIYSAIKVKGKKLYDKARRGEDFVPPKRIMEFRDLEIHSYVDNRLDVSFACSKGSYVRAWAKKLGEELGCGATLASLRRTQSQPYTVDQSIPLDTLQEEGFEVGQGFIALAQCLPGWPLIKVDGVDEKLLCNGQISRKLERFLELEYAGRDDLPGLKVVSRRSGRLLSLLSHQPPLSFKIRRVFPNQ